MFARKSMLSPAARTTALAAVAALALTAAAPTAALAGGRHYHGGGAAAAAAFAGIVGTGLAIAAAQNRADYYDGYAYGGGPVYVEPQPYYYGGYGAYGPSYGPGPHGWGTTAPYVNGHPLADW